jgi:hypothetical protein
MATDARFRDTLKSLVAALGSPDPARRQKARQTIRDTLAVNQKSWNDFLATLQFRGQHSDKLKKLFAMLGQDNDGEFDNARQKISDLLARERRTWRAFVDSLFSTSSNSWPDWHDHAASDPAINPLDLVHHLLWRYLEMTQQQFVAVSLWIAHTFVYQRFTVTPRLMVTSPVRGCGKTTLLDLLEAMCVRPLKSDSITAAGIYHAVDRGHPTLLIDEADNLGLAFNGALRAVLNSGHRRGGKVTRYHGGQARLFSTFAPVAVDAIGTLPLPVMHRSIVIHMQRRDGRRQTQWRGIFVVLTLYGVLTLIWSALRMPETLPEQKSLAVRDVLGAFRQTVTNRQTIGYALAAGGVQASLYGFVFSSEQVFTEIYALGNYFPLAFAAIAVGIAVAGFLNARFVGWACG